MPDETIPHIDRSMNQLWRRPPPPDLDQVKDCLASIRARQPQMDADLRAAEQYLADNGGSFTPDALAAVDRALSASRESADFWRAFFAAYKETN